MTPMRFVLFPTASTAVLLLAACGGSAPTRPSASTPAETAMTEPAPLPPKRITSLTRAEVKGAVERGLGAFLQHITVEDWPVMREGKFYGFTLRTIPADWGVDLKPGDVVTRVNGIVPERPEQADAALRTLETAASLRIEYERDGEARIFELPIVD